MDKPVSQYDLGLDKTQANYVPLSPISFLARSAHVYPKLTSVVHEQRRFTWAETYARSRRFASWLVAQGIRRGDTVGPCCRTSRRCMKRILPCLWRAQS